MKNIITLLLLLIAGMAIGQKTMSYSIDTITVPRDSGFYLIERVEEVIPGIDKPKVTSTPFFCRDTSALMDKITSLMKSSEFKRKEAEKKIEEAKALNFEASLRLKQAEILTGLKEDYFVAPKPIEVPTPKVDPVIKEKSKPKKKPKG